MIWGESGVWPGRSGVSDSLPCATVSRLLAPPPNGRRKAALRGEARALKMTRTHSPGPQGLYDPQHEHDACGVGFVVDLKGRKSSKIVQNALQVLLNLEHRGACGAEKNTGDGACI